MTLLGEIAGHEPTPPLPVYPGQVTEQETGAGYYAGNGDTSEETDMKSDLKTLKTW